MRLLSILLLIGYNACGQCPCVSTPMLGIAGQSNAGSPCGTSVQPTPNQASLYNVYDGAGSSFNPTTTYDEQFSVGVNTGYGGAVNRYDAGIIALANSDYDIAFKYAVAGTGVIQETNRDDWNVNSTGELLDKWCFYHDVAKQSYEDGIPVMDALIWIHGERDIVQGNITYASDMLATFQQMWACVGYNFEIIVVKIGDNATSFTTAEIQGMQSQQDQLCASSPFIQCIEYTYDYCDGLHHSNNGVIQLGNDIANILNN